MGTKEPNLSELANAVLSSIRPILQKQLKSVTETKKQVLFESILKRNQVDLSPQARRDWILETINEAFLKTMQEAIKSQLVVARVFQNITISEIQQMMTRFYKKPEGILLIAVLSSEEKRLLREAIQRLMKKLDNGKSFIEGEPPKLVILDETLTYEEVLSLENIIPKYKKIIGKKNIDEIKDVDETFQNLIRLIRDAKAHTQYFADQEIKRQSSKSRYRELSFEDIESSFGCDGLQDYICDKSEAEILIEKLEYEAKSLGFRRDRIENTLKVAQYALSNASLKTSYKSPSLGLSRDTIFERKKDIRLLLESLKNSKVEK